MEVAVTVPKRIGEKSFLGELKLREERTFFLADLNASFLLYYFQNLFYDKLEGFH